MTTIKTGTSLIAAGAILSACAFLVLSDQPAFAESQAPHDDFAFNFDYAPQELQSVDKANALLARLQHQVRKRCRTETRLPPSERKLVNQCVDAAMTSAVRDIGSSTLATVYENRTDG